MKRALKRREEAVVENTPSDYASVGQLDECSSKANRRTRTRAAMIGLAISMGATSFLVTRQSDNAMAAEAVGNQKATSSIPTALDKEVNFVPKRLYNPIASNVSISGTSTIVKPTAISNLPGSKTWKTASIGTSKQLINKTNGSDLVNKLSSFQKTRKAAKLKAATQKLSVNKKVVNNISSATVTSSDSVAAVKSVTKVSSQLKAQQQFAFNRLQQKSNRLKASLAKLRTEGGEKQSSPVSKSFLQSANTVDKTTNLNAIKTIPQQSATTRDAESATLVSNLKQNSDGSQSALPYVVSSSYSRKDYKVKSGDTLAEIAAEHGVSVSELATVNKLDNPNKLQVSQQLIVPANKNYNSTTETSVAFHPKFVELKNNNRAQTDQVVEAAQEKETETFIAQGVGGENPKIFSEMRVARNRIARNKGAKENDQRLRSLKAEIERLRQKYRDQQSGKRSSKQGSTVNSASSAVTVPTKTAPKNTSVPVNVPKPLTQQRNTAISIPVPKPAAPTYSARPLAPKYSIPVPLNRNSGSANLPKSTRLSAPLPPLAAVDRYLPKVIEQNQPKKSKGFVWPAKGTLTSGYGWRWGRMHKGIDIAAPTGTPINAVANGVVASAGWNRGGYGYLVEIRHANNIITRYAHNSKILVKKGQTVEQGQRISLMGSTGFSTGPHLHFEIRPNGKAKNPIAFLPKKRK
ncbi:MAG: peptidoglycan DD-metalloendopeptidase family protein [Cyanobacteria bacterium P01_A01_bin.84]